MPDARPSRRELRFQLRTSDGLRLHAREWRPRGEPRALLGLIHGHGEHGDRYRDLACSLNRCGCSVVALDLRGHGRSDGIRSHIGSYGALMSDISGLVQETGHRHPDLPFFLYGHSMGGNLVLNYALRHSAFLSGVIASAPLLRTAFDRPAWKEILGHAMRHLWPTMRLSSGLKIEHLSRDPAIVRAYREDPLVHDRVTPCFVEVLRAGEWALAHAADLSLPLLLLHGDDDRITSPQASADFARRAGGNCTLRIWPGLYHEIHNEPEKDQVFTTIAEWLEIE